MQELQGHHDFVMGHYASALAYYETVMLWGAPSKDVQKRAIVCYIETGQPEKALSIFEALIEKDPSFLLARSRDALECPCQGIIQEYANRLTEVVAQADMLAMGMLWSYCDPHISVLWFDKVLRRDPGNVCVKAIRTRLYSHCIIP
jgi:tetratricopeptide (TPR) repeat protein